MNQDNLILYLIILIGLCLIYLGYDIYQRELYIEALETNCRDIINQIYNNERIIKI